LVNDELHRFLSPLKLDNREPLLRSDDSWDGWPFGQDLFVAEIISLIQQVSTVKFVLDVTVFYREVVPIEERSIFEEDDTPPLKPVDKILRLPVDGLICSLEHEIETTTMETAYGRK